MTEQFSVPSKAKLFPFLPTEIEGVESLIELALDLRSSWNHGADVLWKQLDPELWELTLNPWIVLKTASREKIKLLLADPEFRKIVDQLIEAKHKKVSSPAWFQENYSGSPLSCIAYFSMEFMLSEALPIYSGGLGNVAGDQLKAANDLGVPVVAVGLLYQQGYFRQIIDKDGMQQAFYPYNDPGQLPITPLRKSNGEWIRLEIALPGWSVWLRAWQAQVGNVKLYLLDSNDLANYPPHRGITSELYGGGSELRLKQEIILGIGGWRLLEALGHKPEVCHLNEGHAAFAVLERAKSFMKQADISFTDALAVTRAGNLFTTHTAVSAGFDRFSPVLIEQYLLKYAQNQLGITLHELLALGRQNPNDATEYFNMAYLAIRASGAVNAVSALHGNVSRHIFSPLFPRWPEEEVPVGFVTNGVHMPTWDSAEADALWTETCGKSRWLGKTEILEKEIQHASDEKIWQMRNASRKSLVEFTRRRLARQIEARGASRDEVEHVKNLFNPDALTIGFARRFATYKRPTMLLHDTDRLLRILTHSQRPVQLIIAGKAHPADKLGQEMIQEWMQFIKRPEVRAHIVFLSDYDIRLAEKLVQGVDVWINTPRRPWEACGTSGMKILVNGGLNLSELDGWWAEAYTPKVGWAIGDGKEHEDDSAWDAIEAEALYTLLEQEIMPEFYARENNGLPLAWIARIRESMATLTPRFSANRAVRQYTEEHYLIRARAYLARAQNKGAFGKKVAEWQSALKEKWASISFVDTQVKTVGDQHEFAVQVSLNDVDPNYVKAELYAEALTGGGSLHQEMTLVPQVPGESVHTYRAVVPSSRLATDYTPRLVPYFPGATVPLESGQILWQR